MIRNYLSNIIKEKKDRIIWRSHEVARIEAFSDAVFGFAISLLIISLEVPKNSGEMLRSLVGFIPFAFCFAAIFGIWRAQYTFFRRYGMHDEVTIWLNGVLLFVTLAYVYPLKFVINSSILPESGYVIEKQDTAAIFILFLSGLSVINLLFGIMYTRAYIKRRQLKLTPVEIFETVTYVCQFFIPVVFVVAAAVFAYQYRHEGEQAVPKSAPILVGMIIAVPVYKKLREHLFKKKFGGIREVEINHNPEG